MTPETAQLEYTLGDLLGAGGTAEVRQAVLPDGRVFAVKQLARSAASEDREQLAREAEIAATLDHPNVARLIAVHEHQGALSLLYEWVDGTDLARIVRVVGPSILSMRRMYVGSRAAHGPGLHPSSTSISFIAISRHTMC